MRDVFIVEAARSPLGRRRGAVETLWRAQPGFSGTCGNGGSLQRIPVFGSPASRTLGVGSWLMSSPVLWLPKLQTRNKKRPDCCTRGCDFA